MTLSIPTGELQIWNNFSLWIEHDLEFETGKTYHLQGNNGSGKSSFLSRVLLPHLQNSSSYLLYLQQQMHTQLYAVQAYAAVMKPPQILKTEQEVVNYLGNDLVRNYQLSPRPAFVLVDESRFEAELVGIISLNCPLTCFILASHHGQPSGATLVRFEPVTPNRSKVCIPSPN